MVAVLYWPVNLVNNQTISQKGFLKEPTLILVMSSGTTMGFSKNSSKISMPLSCFFRKCLQYSPLKVSVGSRSFNILWNTCVEREMGGWSWICIIRWLDMYFWTHHATSYLHLNTSGTHPAQAIPKVQIISFCAGGDEQYEYALDHWNFRSSRPKMSKLSPHQCCLDVATIGWRECSFNWIITCNESFQRYNNNKTIGKLWFNAI